MGFLRDLFSRNQSNKTEETASLQEGVFANDGTGFATVYADGYAIGSSDIKSLCRSVAINLEMALDIQEDERQIYGRSTASADEHVERAKRLKQVMIDAGHEIDAPEAAATPEQPAP